MHWVYYFGRCLIRIVALFFGGWKVRGRENISSRGPFLVICNHLHIADPPILAASLPLKCVLMAKEELWHNGWNRFWVSNFGAFPVRRGAIDREAIRQAELWLSRGVSVIMFPEGGRSQSGQLQPALPGAVLVATRTGVPVLPVAITGTEKLKNLIRAFFRHPHIVVNIGKPFRLMANNDKPDREQRRQLTHEMMQKIASLLPPEYRGVYAEEKHATD